MADEADRAEMDIERELDASIRQVQNKAAMMPLGTPGTCSRCGGHSPRLIGAACAPCRDKYKLP